MQIRFLEWAKNGTCIEFGRDLQGRCNDVDVFNAKTQGIFEHGKHGGSGLKKEVDLSDFVIAHAFTALEINQIHPFSLYILWPNVSKFGK